MYVKLTFATLLLAGAMCPLAPAKYTEVSNTRAAATSDVHFAKASVVADYTVRDDSAPGEEEFDQVGGADVQPAVWYHTPDVSIVFSDVSKKDDTKKRASKPEFGSDFEPQRIR